MTRSSTNISPEELVEMFFKMVEPTDSPKSFASLRYIKGMTEPLTRVLSKQTIVYPTTTVPGLEVSTFTGFSDKQRTKNSLCQMFVVLHWRNGRAFKTRKKGHFWNVKIETKGWRMTKAPSPEFWKAWRVSSQYLEFPAFSRIVVRETCAFHRCGGELGIGLRTPTWRDIAKDIDRTARKWQLTLAQGPELEDYSASQQLSFA